MSDIFKQGTSLQRWLHVKKWVSDSAFHFRRPLGILSLYLNSNLIVVELSPTQQPLN